MSTAIVQQLNQISTANDAGLAALDRSVVDFAGVLSPELANRLIATVRTDLQQLDVRPALAAIVEQLG